MTESQWCSVCGTDFCVKYPPLDVTVTRLATSPCEVCASLFDLQHRQEIPLEFRVLHKEIDQLRLQVTEWAWREASKLPCTCGGHEDGWHSKHCRRRRRAEELEAGYGVRR
jgi:hypothetical protein